MKKYISILLITGILIISVFAYNTFKVEEETVKHFSESGYILQSSSAMASSQKIDRIYFEENGNYKPKYNEKVVFNDTNGENVTTGTDNFIHYSDGSISSFKNGVILDLANIDTTPIFYYNIKSGNTLKKQNNIYTIKNLDKDIKFASLIWKISNNKYIIISNNLEIVFDDGTTNSISGYLELEYSDNEVVKLYNQEITYQTISSRIKVMFPNNIELNVSKKTISKDKETKLSLENMVIDSNDNVNIVDLSDEENNDKNNEENNTIENTVSQPEYNGGQDSNETNNSNQEENNNTIINAGGTVADNENGGNSDDTEVKNVKEPKYKIEKFDVGTIGVTVGITIEDEENLLTEGTTIKILKNNTGKTVYEIEEELGNYNIDLDIQSLETNTEYTLVAESTYQIDGITYNKNFISKIFRTGKIGITLEKDVFTDTSLAFNIRLEKNSRSK